MERPREVEVLVSLRGFDISDPQQGDLIEAIRATLSQHAIRLGSGAGVVFGEGIKEGPIWKIQISRIAADGGGSM